LIARRRSGFSPHLVAFLPFRHQPRNDFGRVLQVHVHGDDGVAGGLLQSGGERRFLAEVAGQVHHDQARAGLRGFQQAGQGVVGAAVVDEDVLELMPSQGVGHPIDGGEEAANSRGLVKGRDDE
jgi:hypothetical protein